MSKSSGARIEIPTEIAEGLGRLAKQRRRSEGELIVEALRLYLSAHDPQTQQREIDRACREINKADAHDPELWAWVEAMQAPID